MTDEEADRITAEAGRVLCQARDDIAKAVRAQRDIDVALAVRKWQRARREYKRAFRECLRQGAYGGSVESRIRSGQNEHQ